MYCRRTRADMFNSEFLQLIILIWLSFIFSVFLLYFGWIISPKNVEGEKLIEYECGFLPIGDARQPFHVRFYLIALLFLLFDIEIVYLIPWVVSWHLINHCIFAFITIFSFIFLLIFGFYFEWKTSALDWELFIRFFGL